jgi:uncharacterized protein YecE (DUF72 family)
MTAPIVTTAEHSYLRLRHASYTPADIERWTAVGSEQQKQLKDVYVYFKHEESGIGPQFAKQMLDSLKLNKS